MSRPPKINPFKPFSPVSPGMFIGRVLEIQRLEASLLQTRAGQCCNLLCTGERGIGKTSLLNYLKYVAEGHIPIEEDRVKFLVVDTDIDQSTTQIGLVRKIELGLKRQLDKSEPARKYMREAWGFVKRVEVGGVGIKGDKDSEQDETAMEEFAYALADIADRVCSDPEQQNLFGARFDGLLILVDEADNASRSLGLGSFLKLLTERLHRRGCDRVMIALAGLPKLMSLLSTSHPSSLRLFDEVPLDRLSRKEVNRVIDICLDKAFEQNRVRISINDDARDYLVSFSEGYPHFIQQFGYSAFAVDKDNVIGVDDVLEGAFGERGALELIGDRYYRDSFYNKIQKESYRQVLRIMADHLDTWVTKAEIKKRFKGQASTLDNALHALKNRDIILPKEGERGMYRLQHKGFGLWIKFYTSKPSDFAPAPKAKQQEPSTDQGVNSEA